MPEYRVVAGTYRTDEGELAETGDTVEVSEDVADRFPRTFEPVDDETDDQQPEGEGYEVDTTENDADESEDTSEDDEPADESEAQAEDEGELAPSAEIPDDYGTLSSMAAEYDGDEIHGAMSGDEISEFLETLSTTEVNALKRNAVEDTE